MTADIFLKEKRQHIFRSKECSGKAREWNSLSHSMQFEEEKH